MTAWPARSARCTPCSTGTRCSHWRPGPVQRPDRRGWPPLSGRAPAAGRAATGARPTPGPAGMHALLGAAADCVTRAIGHAMLAAETVQTPVREWRSYRDTFPSAFPAVPTVSDEGGLT